MSKKPSLATHIIAWDGFEDGGRLELIPWPQTTRLELDYHYSHGAAWSAAQGMSLVELRDLACRIALVMIFRDGLDPVAVYSVMSTLEEWNGFTLHHRWADGKANE